MNSIESTESVDFESYFCKIAVFEPTTSCVTNQDAMTVPAQHLWGTETNSCFSDFSYSPNLLNSAKVLLI